MKRGMRGFTLVELVVVMVIIGILAVIAVPMYRGYVIRAQDAEGRALCGSVATAEKVYYSEFGEFYYIGALTSNDPILEVDATMNTYFDRYIVANDGSNGFIVTSNGRVGSDADGRTVGLTQPLGGPPTWN